MTDAAVVYTLNLIIGVILAAVMTRHRELRAGSGTLVHWIRAAWCLAGADFLFVLRAEIAAVPRMLPTLTVTAGHVLLWLAAQHATVGWSARRLGIAVVLVHLLLLSGYAVVPSLGEWRTVTNGLMWGGLSLATAVVLWRAPARVGSAMAIPALVMAAQGAFHAVRTTLAVRAAAAQGAGGSMLVQRLGDLEVSLFMVALFVSILVGYLELSYTDLREAKAEVEELSGLLPLCAWCNKVRDDSGYWRRIETFLKAKQIRVTHSLCESCATEHFAHETTEELTGVR
jgi:hypothetical protein